jgi:hypothetical protein
MQPLLQVLIPYVAFSNHTIVCAQRLKGSSTLYPIPLAGPIIVGTVRGAGGLFFPPDKGLSGLKAGLPFNAQIALVCAALWHLAVNDEFVLGGMLRGAISTLTLGMVGGAVGSTQLRPDALKCAIVVFFLVMNVLQVRQR